MSLYTPNHLKILIIRQTVSKLSREVFFSHKINEKIVKELTETPAGGSWYPVKSAKT